jgi:4-amino-4-deoxy-L-arabinose transferase-like glycosyltransferase
MFPADRGRSSGVLLIGVLLLALLVFGIPAGRRPLWSSDEARFAVLAQDILDHGRWLVPHLRSDVYLNKPQLYFWSIAALSWPGGHVTELTAAVPSVISAVATVGAVAAIGRLLWGGPAGLLAALILIATPPFYSFSHLVLADVMMTAFMTWAFYFLLRAASPGARAGTALAFYACVGGAVLAKGPAGLAALAAGIAATVATRPLGGRAALRPLHGLAVLATLGVVWFTPYLARSHGTFVSQVFVSHYAPWYLSGAVVPRLGQLVALLLNFLPWTVLLVAAVPWWRRHPDEGRRWIATATLILALLLALSGTQRARYLLPVYPGLALLTAEFVVRGTRSGGATSLRIGVWALAGFAGLAAVAAPFLFGRVTGSDRVFVPDVGLERGLVVGLVVAVALAVAFAARRGAFTAGVAVAAGLVALVLMVEGVTYPRRYARAYDLRPLADAATQHSASGTTVVAYPDTGPSLDFYVRRHVVSPATPDSAVGVASELPSVIVTDREHWLQLALPPAWRVVASRRVAGREMLVVAP